MRLRYVPAILLTIFLALLRLAPTAYSRIQVQSGQIGNLFLTDQKVRIPLTSNGTEISWKVTDYFGNTITEGRQALMNKRAIIQPGVIGVGYFDLTLTEYRGTDVTSTLKTSFAVLPPVEVSGSSRFGVMTHFAQYHDPAIIPLLAKSGIIHFRDEQYWSWIEQKQGTYHYPQKYVDYMASARAIGLQPLIDLTWSNPCYDYEEGDYTMPHSEAGKVGYIKYALELLRHYSGQIKYVEIWNEVNAGTFIKGPATQDKAYYYGELLKTVYPAIKAARPDVSVLAGATVPIAHGFFRDLFRHGAGPFLDAVSVHPYGSLESLPLEISELRNLMEQENGGVLKPIWVTEFGLATSSEKERKAAASHLAQVVPLMLSAGVERMYYYLAMDDDLFPYRGLVGRNSDARGAFRPHPGLVAYAILIRQLNGAIYHSRFSTSPSTYALRFQRGNKQVSVLWSNYPVTVSLKSAAPLRIIDIMGRTATKEPVFGSVELNLGSDVQYVVGPVSAVGELDNKVIADSVSGYSKNAGQNGWYYGYAELDAGENYNLSKFQPMRWGIWGTDNYRWLGSGDYPFATGSGMHPSGAWAIRRWVSNLAGAVSLSGLLSRGEGGDGVEVRIFVDGQQVYRRTLSPVQSVNYSVPNIVVKVGSKIDFTVNQRSESSFDATTFTSTIMRQDDASPSEPRDLPVTE
jgi:Glycosyl hydrolase catalytic core